MSSTVVISKRSFLVLGGSLSALYAFSKKDEYIFSGRSINCEHHLVPPSSNKLSSSPATADIMDVYQGQVQAVGNSFRDYGGVNRFHGQIATLHCIENNPLVRQRLTKENGHGKVLVVDGGGSLKCALMGDILATGAVENGWEGVIINGAIRDSAEIKGMNLGVKALGTNPTKSSKIQRGDADVMVSFEGLTFTPGHWVYADEDGIVVSKFELKGP